MSNVTLSPIPPAAVRTTSTSDQLARAEAAVCRVYPIDGTGQYTGNPGTGFAVSRGTYVITAAHVVPDVGNVILSFREGPRKARVMARSSLTDDIAILELESEAPACLDISAQSDTAGPLLCWKHSSLEPQSPFHVAHVPVLFGRTIRPSFAAPSARLLLAGAFTPGMSGGPLYAPLLDAVVGVICEHQGFDPYSLLDCAVTPEAHLVFDAFLSVGVGFAIPAAIASDLLQSFPKTVVRAL